MKRQMMGWILAVTVGAVLLSTTSSVQAGDPGRKLGRGLANVLFGISEIPQTAVKVGHEHGGGAGMTWGVMKGVGRFVMRELVGLYEIITFPIPLPRGYDPILQPEFPFSGDKSDI